MNKLRTNYLPTIFSDLFTEDMFFPTKSKFVPSVNVKEDESSFQIEVAAPGYKKDSFNIEVKDNTLTISSKIESTNEETNDKYHRREFYSSSFERSFYLDKNLNSEQIEASYNDGILSVSIPKVTKKIETSKTIEIK